MIILFAFGHTEFAQRLFAAKIQEFIWMAEIVGGLRRFLSLLLQVISGSF